MREITTTSAVRACCLLFLLLSAVGTLAAADPIQHQITLSAGQNWCDDGMIHSLLSEVNGLRVSRGLSPLQMDPLGMKVAEVRATQFIAYMAAHTPGSPGFNPHEGWDTTSAQLGYNIISENLAYLSAYPSMIVYNHWNSPLHMAAMLASDANVAGVSCVYSDFVPYWTFTPGICSGATCGPAAPEEPGDSTPLSAEQWAFLTLINQFRADNGLPALSVSATLQRAAQWHSDDMATKNYASHTDSLGRDVRTRLLAFGYAWSPWGENIAGGYDDAQSTFNQWLTACDPDSSGTCTYAHRKMMLGAGFAAIGIGRTYHGNSTYGWYWTTDFGGYVEQRVEPGTPLPSTPSIGSLTATPSSITAGQVSTLSWSVTGATSVVIDNGIGQVALAGMKSILPTASTTYRLTASNTAGTSTAVVTVVVQATAVDKQAPTVPASLTAAAASASEVRLTWQSSSDNLGVTGYRVLRNGALLGTVAVTSFSDVTVQASTAYTYQVQAYDAAGNVSASAVAHVTTPATTSACGNPGVGTFTACYYDNISLSGAPVLVRTDSGIAFDSTGSFPPPSISAAAFSVLWRGTFSFTGGKYRFSTVSSDGMRVYVDGALIFDGWRDQAPIMMYGTERDITAGEHLVTVEFYSRTGRPTAHLSWTKTGDSTQSTPPVILSFASTPSAIAPGQHVTLAWNVAGATSVRIDNGIGDVPAGAWRSVFPSQTTTYKLTASNGSMSVTAAATVTVTAASADMQPPSTPPSLSAVLNGQTDVTLNWQPSTDNIGVVRYQITRNGVALATVMHPTISYNDKTVSANTAYIYGVIAYDAAGNASRAATASISTPSAPGTASCSAPVTGAFGGCYFAGTDLSGAPFFSRTDPQVNFGGAAAFPPSPVPSAGFSARWDGTFPFEDGSYVFTVTASDGIRLYIDGVPTFDRWVDQVASTYMVLRSPGAGSHRITIEYYSRTGSPIAQVSWRKR